MFALLLGDVEDWSHGNLSVVVDIVIAKIPSLSDVRSCAIYASFRVELLH
ncbi:MAG: hypothetical protein RMI56_03040 [Sulfolobales archaeon]|nr:hypothetical protein [Sulfolobales archaeon]MDW8082756.1 hypothetical protein [Sulfolobales archaeon]